MTTTARGKGKGAVKASAAAAAATSKKPGPRPVYYQAIDLAPSIDDPRRLDFIAAPGAPKLPDDVKALRREYERTARVVSVLFDQDAKTRREIFMLLHRAADRGLRGPDFSIEDGRDNLDSVRDAITDFAHKVRDRRLREYTRLVVICGLLPLLLGAAVFLTDGFGCFPRTAGKDSDQLFIWILALLWIPAGATICVWGEFVLRMQAGLQYEQLLNLDPSRWRPVQRLTITIGIAFIFAYVLAFDVVQIGLGPLLLNDFARKTPGLSLAVGGITGLAFTAVRDILFRIKTVERPR